MKKPGILTGRLPILVIDPEEYQRIENKEGEDMETFELISPETKQIKVRNNLITFDNDYKNYEQSGIKVRDWDNPRKLIGFAEIVRYLHATNPGIISATDEDIRKHIPKDLPAMITIDNFHVGNSYTNPTPPHAQETYILIAKVLVTRDITNWKPTQEPNNHWSNWESGFL